MKIDRNFIKALCIYKYKLASLNLINFYSDRIDCLRSKQHNKSIWKKNFKSKVLVNLRSSGHPCS